MAGYKLYRVGSDGHILWRHDCSAHDDVDSLDHAKELCTLHDVEVWQADRFVARVSKDGTANLVEPSAETIPAPANTN